MVSEIGCACWSQSFVVLQGDDDGNDVGSASVANIAGQSLSSVDVEGVTYHEGQYAFVRNMNTPSGLPHVVSIVSIVRDSSNTVHVK